MSEENKAIVRRAWEECFNRGNLGIIDELIAPDFVWHGPGQDVSGRDGLRGLISMVRGGFPDLEFTVNDQMAEGDSVLTRWTMRGTHKGELFGIPATNNQAAFTDMVVSRMANGQIAEEWEQFDRLGLMQQLGVIPRQ